MTHTEPCLRVRIRKALVARVHTRWDALGQARLVGPIEAPVENLRHQCTKLVRVHGGVGATFDGIPAGLCQLRRCVPARVRYEAAVCLAIQVSLCRAPTFSSSPPTRTYITASSSLTLLSTSKPPSFHSPLSDVYTEATLRLPCIEDPSSLINLIVFWTLMLDAPPHVDQARGRHTATLYSPHFVVSGLKLFRLTCHRRGTSRSVAM